MKVSGTTNLLYVTRGYQTPSSYPMIKLFFKVFCNTLVDKMVKETGLSEDQLNAIMAEHFKNIPLQQQIEYCKQVDERLHARRQVKELTPKQVGLKILAWLPEEIAKEIQKFILND